MARVSRLRTTRGVEIVVGIVVGTVVGIVVGIVVGMVVGIVVGIVVGMRVDVLLVGRERDGVETNTRRVGCLMILLCLCISI